MTSLSITHASAGIARPSFIANFIKRLTRAHADRRTIAELSNLDDRLLDDIGLSRSRIRDAVARARGADLVASDFCFQMSGRC